ncbi:MAG TPA: hypothetical protein VGQ75_08390 [Thermoanaerobaculia bacterium]|nr:hypothetical protein [Thermoanaerobaculia bacterium]
MVIPLFARVTGFKIEDAWRRGSRGLVRCTARLSRALRQEEAERVQRLVETQVNGSEVVHECRPEVAEDWHAKLTDALAGTPTRGEGRAAVGERRTRRSPRKGGAPPPRSPEPAA